MDTMTINISMPKPLYADAKRAVAKRRYVSISELVRDAVRRVLYPGLTVNGFTPEFEAEVLRREKEPVENDIEWDGRGSFTNFVLKEGEKKYGSIPRHREILQKHGGVVERVSRAKRGK